MKNLVLHIEYMLQSHDCVVIPGLGAILCHGEVAVCDERGIWHAPTRVMSFNPELDRTDGLLAASVARRENVSLDTAAASVNAAVAAMRQCLATSGRVQLGLVGRLEMTPHGTLAFCPDNSPWLSPSTLWLPELDLHPVGSASEIARKVEKEIVGRSRVRRIATRVASAAASVAAVLALAWVVKTTLPEAPAEQLASVAPVASSSNILRTPGDDRNTLVLVVNRHDDSSVAVEEPQAETVAAPAVAVETVDEKPAAQTLTRCDGSDSHFLVVASLNSHDEAERYISKHSNFNLGILTVDGRFRVYVASGNSYAAAAKANTGDIAASFPNAWVCRR